ncbi:MAG: caa(3)-type oxidase subunit IV [Planctomycetia bacterium]|nr:caa(3)-type oxidase subunit IV [Planctomycetia bacterium]
MAEHKPTSPTIYLGVYVSLLLLTLLTVWIASTFTLGSLEVPVAMGIASIKTILVGAIFMHLSHSSKLVWLSIGAAIVFLAIMIGIVMIDYNTRGWVPLRGEDPVIRGV